MQAAATSISKAERTRQLIIEKAAHLFNVKGYAGTSLQDIMLAANLTKGGIYGHFESKEEIALAAFEYAAAHVISAIRQRIMAHTSATRQLEALLAFYRSYILHPTITGGCPLLNTAVEADDTNPLLRAAVVKVFNKLHKAVAGMVQEGIKQGEFKTTANPERFAILLVSMIEGGVMISKAYGNNKYLNTVLDHLQHLIESDLKL